MYTNGGVARYAKVVYRSLGTEFSRAKRDGFTFFRDNEGVWYLYDYAGTQAMTLLAIPEIGNDVVILPNAFAGARVTSLRVPDTTGQIKESALAGINGLTTIYFEGVMDEFNALKGKNYLTGSSWQDSQLKIYYQHYEHCVHGEGQWAEVDGVIITTPCELILEETTPPTCDAYGVLTSKCGCEGCTYYETAPIDMIEHVFENGACTGCDKKQILLTAESFAELEAETIIVNNGFLLTDGELASTNTSANSTATIVFKNTVPFTLSFDWHVSSEANFDVFSVTSNKRGVLLTASGENMSGTESIEVMTGERITVSYKKDSGNSMGLDRAMLTNVQIIY